MTINFLIFALQVDNYAESTKTVRERALDCAESALYLKKFRVQLRMPQLTVHVYKSMNGLRGWCVALVCACKQGCLLNSLSFLSWVSTGSPVKSKRHL